MKLLFQSFLVCGLFSHAQAVTYFDNFNSYTPGTAVSSISGWNLVASDPTVAIISTSPFPFPATSGGRAIHFGFQEFAETSAYLYRSPGSSLVGNTAGYTEFQAVFTVQDSVELFSTPPAAPLPPGTGTPRDNFSFTFRGAANENILTITLKPTAQSTTPDLPPNRVDQFSWTSDFAGGNPNIGTLNEGQWSTLNVKFTPSGINDVAFSVKFQNVEFAAGTLVGASAQTLGEFGMIWNPLDPTNEGSNILIIDDVRLIPEPTSALLAGLGAIGFALRRRRA
jgi:hypothetical protein